MIAYRKELFVKKKYVFGRIIGVAIIILILLFLSTSSMPVSTTYSFREMDDPQYYFYMVQGNMVEQQIQFRKPYVDRMGVCISNITYGIQGTLKLELHEKGSEEILANSEINLANAKDREFIWFDVKCEVDKDKVYQLDIITENVVGELAILSRIQDDNLAEMIEPATEYGVPLDGYLAVDISYRAKLDISTMICLWMLGTVMIVYILGWEEIIATRSRLRKSILATIMVLILPFFYNYCVPDHNLMHTKLYLGLAGYYILLLFITFILFMRNKIPFLAFFIAVTLLNGIAYSLVFMPMSSPDETTHFYESYRLSNIIMGQESTDEYGNILVRQCDTYEKMTQINDKYTIQLWEKSIETTDSTDEQMVSSDFPWIIYAPILGYIPQALGISFARLLHVNYFWLLYLGRFANLLFFTILVSVGVSMAPKAKWIVLTICNFPFLVQEVATYSYDTLIIAFAILLGCYIYKLMEQNKQMSIKQIVVLLILCLCFANFKPVYFPLIGLIFLIPNKNVNNCKIKAILMKVIIVTLSLAMMLVVYHHISPLNMESLQGEYIVASPEEPEASEIQAQEGWIYLSEGIIHYSSGETKSPLSYLLCNPLDMFQRIVYTLFQSIDWFVLYIFGNYMGGHEIRIPVVVTILFMWYFFHTITEEKDNEYSGKILKMKAFILFLNCVCLLGLILVSYLQWSPLGKRELIGIQGRYFYPLFISLIFVNSRKRQETKKDYFADLSIVSLVHVLTLLYSQSIIWNR